MSLEREKKKVYYAQGHLFPFCLIGKTFFSVPLSFLQLNFLLKLDSPPTFLKYSIN